MPQYLSNTLLSQDFLEAFFAEFLTAEGASKKTKKNYISDVKQFSQWLEQYKKIEDFNKETVQHIGGSIIKEYIDFILLQHKPSTANRHLSSLRTFFRACHTSGFIKKNPVIEYTVDKQAVASPVQDTNKKLWPYVQTNPQQFSESETEDVQEFFKWINQYKTIK